MGSSSNLRQSVDKLYLTLSNQTRQAMKTSKKLEFSNNGPLNRFRSILIRPMFVICFSAILNILDGMTYRPDVCLVRIVRWYVQHAFVARFPRLSISPVTVFIANASGTRVSTLTLAIRPAASFGMIVEVVIDNGLHINWQAGTINLIPQVVLAVGVALHGVLSGLISRKRLRQFESNHRPIAYCR